MKAITKHRYGGSEVLQLEEVEKPTVKPEHLLVKVEANSANPADWHTLRGEPRLARLSFGLLKPKHKILGADFAGTVEAVGDNVTNFKVGERVFGDIINGGAFAEYACVPAQVCAQMPEGTEFPEMAGIPIAGLTALQALIMHGELKEGESVLINGASGGVGHLAVQIAKAYGAWGEKSMYGKKYEGIIRSSLLIDEQGKVVDTWYKVSPKDTVNKALKRLEEA